MNQRERYIAALSFKTVDKVPFEPGGPRESTLRRWRSEGLPEGADWRRTVFDIIGLPEEPMYDRVNPGVDFRMIPQFQEEVLEHRDGHYIVRDWMGAITEISDEFDYTYIRNAKDFVTRKWHKFPVETREDWQEMKKRYQIHAAGRFPDDFVRRAEKLKEREYVCGIHFNAPFWQLREWLGMENLCMMFIDDPDFVAEMVEFWTEFIEGVLLEITSKIKLDVVGMSEDMAYKAHPMISPAMTREFLQPAYKRWVKIIRDSGCPLIDMDSDGYIDDLIPIWIESDINVCDPVEVAAYNDIVLYREKYGNKIAFRGGIDKRAIAAGGKTMEAELMRVIPPLIKDGGYIPGCDHGVPHDISWQNFIDYCRLLAKLCGWL